MIRSLILTKDQPEQEPSSSLSGADHENHMYDLCYGMEFHIHEHFILYTYIKMACQL